MNDDVRFVEANGLRFATLEEGQGPLALLVHGFPDTPHSWDDLRPRLVRAGYRVVCPFLRGYRPSAIPARDTDLETLARDVVALIPALGAERALVVGHDWGAVAAYGAAALAPERVTQLVTLAIPHPASLRRTPRAAWGVRHFFAYKMPGAAARFARDDFAALRAIYKRWSPAWTPSEAELAPVKACFAERASLEAAMGYYRAMPFAVPRFLRTRITVDTVVFRGTGDTLIGPDEYTSAARWFTKGYAIEATPGGHFLHREHPDVFAERLLAHVVPPRA